MCFNFPLEKFTEKTDKGPLAPSLPLSGRAGSWKDQQRSGARLARLCAPSKAGAGALCFRWVCCMALAIHPA